MDTPKTLRERAEQWRRLAAQHHAGTSDALLDAACELDLRALRLERTPPPPTDARDHAVKPAWRLIRRASA